MSGIENFGLHCFANAVIQCLANVENVIRVMCEHNDRHTIPGKQPKTFYLDLDPINFFLF